MTIFSYPPLEGEGRPHRTKLSFGRCGRGGVIVHPWPIITALPAAHPTPVRITLRAIRADPPPPGEGKQEMRQAPIVICDSPALRRIRRNAVIAGPSATALQG